MVLNKRGFVRWSTVNIFSIIINIESLMEMIGNEWKLVKMWDVNQLLKMQMLSHIGEYRKPTGVKYETNGMDFYQSAMEQTNKV